MWAHYLRRDVDKLKRLQRLATYMISGFRLLTHEESLARLKPISLRGRPHHVNLISFIGKPMNLTTE